MAATIQHPDSAAVYAEAFAAGLRPPPRLTVSEWADEHRMLQGKNAAEPGPFRTDRVPYTREIADALSRDSRVRKVVVMKGAQLGLTEVGNNWIGYTIGHAPCPMLMVMPTKQLAERTSKQRLDPMIESTPELAQVVRDRKGRGAGNTMLVKDYDGGILVLVGANSPADLRSTPARNVFGDELDIWPGEVGSSGDPVKLAERAQRTFATSGAKTFLVSTPGVEGRSRISDEFQDSDRSYYHVPCPDCGELQRLVWRNVRYELDDSGHVDEESVRYACEECGSLWPESAKEAFLAEGVWIPEAPERSAKVRGFHISSLYSPYGWYSWAEAAQQFEDGKSDPAVLKVFVNETLGETWRDRGEAPDWERLYRQREEYKIGTVPAGGLVLTAGVDVQADRLEVEIVAWGRQRESWSVDYVVLPGKVEEQEVWDQLEELVASTYPHASGLRLPIRMMAVDSGFATQTVYSWVRARRRSQVIAIKGRDSLPVLVSAPTPVDVKSGGRKISRGLKLWHVGSGLAKEELYGWLRREPPLHPERDGWPMGWCHFPQYAEGYFRGLTAEEMHVYVKRDKHGGLGRRTYEWTKIRDRNEPLDCRVYARAAAYVVGVDRWGEAEWDKREAELGDVARRAAERAKKDVERSAEPEPQRERGRLNLGRHRRRR
ncbi:MAG: phage terminase large subunit family protein [Planctomycetota bacterium]